MDEKQISCEAGPAYYNEIDPYAAEWLRNLIKAGHIAPGIVDERSIEDVTPDELAGFTQCHFFAGIGVWSLALRRAGWPDDKAVWTGSCPCQPFSAAGKGAGFDDERHLWPAFQHLIKECQPPTVLGEQVASGDAAPWLDLVQIDLEAVGYAFGAVPFPSASIGAPHIRDRLYWVADANSVRLEQKPITRLFANAQYDTEPFGSALRLDNSDHAGLEGYGRGRHPEIGQREGAIRSVGPTSKFGRMGNTDGELAGRNAGTGDSSQRGAGLRSGSYMPDTSSSVRWMADNEGGGWREKCPNTGGVIAGDQSQGLPAGLGDGSSDMRPGPTNGHWRDADWLFCRDEKWRPVEPGTFPLAHGAPARVGRLRAYGNAINAIQAQIFIEAHIAHLRALSGAEIEPVGT